MESSVNIRDPEEAKLIGPGPNRIYMQMNIYGHKRKLIIQHSIRISMLLLLIIMWMMIIIIIIIVTKFKYKRIIKNNTPVPGSVWN